MSVHEKMFPAAAGKIFCGNKVDSWHKYCYDIVGKEEDA
jgi:hypothetical protein